MNLLLLVLVSLYTGLTLAAEETSLNASAPDGIRPGGTLADRLVAPPVAAPMTTTRRPTRNYPEQPPLIPHGIRGYQVDRNFNQCLSCHSRSTAEVTGAPMVSITHFLDREHQPLAAVSPRRYFCLQCHVPQHDVLPARGNHFLNMDQVLRQSIADEVQKR